jgi:hypothetical protein
MNSSGPELRIESVAFPDEKLQVALSDGRLLTFPLEWYPSLQKATQSQRANWRLLGQGEGVHWPQIDEDLSLEGFLNGWPAAGSVEYQRRRASVEYIALDQDLAPRFRTEEQVNEALREYLKLKRESA